MKCFYERVKLIGDRLRRQMRIKKEEKERWIESRIKKRERERMKISINSLQNKV